LGQIHGEKEAGFARRFRAWADKVHRLGEIADALTDRRLHPRVSTASCFSFVLGVFALGQGSFHAAEQALGPEPRRKRWRKRHRSDPPSADTAGYCYEGLDLDGLRAALRSIYTQCQRNHVLDDFTRRGLRMAIVDGHELLASYDLHCPQCSQRTVQTKQGPRTQYHHSVVAAQIGLGPVALPLDLEPILPGENESVAALRLIERLCLNYPKAFDLVAGDGLYANPSVLALLRQHHKHFVAVLKENQPSLLGAANLLCHEIPPAEFREGNPLFQQWDLPGVDWPTADTEVRVVRSIEISEGKKGKASDWTWITTLPQETAGTRLVAHFGHHRWDIENQFFNLFASHLHGDRNFHHHDNAILAVALTALIALALIQLFHHYNLKPQLRARMSLLALINELRASFLTDRDTS
jgi:hypothetical protein